MVTENDPNDIVTEEDLSEAAGSEPAAEVTPEPEETTEASPPEYTPDFSYSVHDEPMEFPEHVRPAVTSKEAEDYIRDLLTKAEGLPKVKSRLDEVTQNFENLQPKYKESNDALEQMKYFAQNDLDTYLQVGGVSEEKLMAHVQNKLRLQELTPEERASVEQGQLLLLS